jgi:D-aminoacyl-tRNA deacylase
MRILIQRVSRAQVTVENGDSGLEDLITGSIGRGLVAFIGIREGDTSREVDWMAEKVANLRVFEDEIDKMNLSLLETGGSVLAISQFTLYGELRKGNRPNFLAAAKPEHAEALYEEFLRRIRERLGTERVATGIFQARMRVELVNEGPVTVLIERENSEVHSEDPIMK